MLEQDQLRMLSNRIDSLARLRRRFLNKRLSSTDLKGHQFLMLLTIMHDPGISQEEISKRIDIDKTRIARSSILLEEKGYIERRRDTEDRRKYHLYLTEQGNELIPTIRGIIYDWGISITEGLSDEEISLLMPMIEVLYNNARKHDDPAVI